MSQFLLFGRWQYQQGQGHVVTCDGAAVWPVRGNVYEFIDGPCKGMRVAPPADGSPALVVRARAFEWLISIPPYFHNVAVVEVRKPDRIAGGVIPSRFTSLLTGGLFEQPAVLAYAAAVQLGLRFMVGVESEAERASASVEVVA